MGDGLLMLSWKNHGSTFSHVLSSLREKDHYTDVTLACDGKFYPAHKIVLSACSQYFEDMLQNTPCKHPIIVLKDISAHELDALLSYMYTGEVSVNQNHLTSLIKAAESLHIKGIAVPDELPASTCNAKDNRSLYTSTDERISPPAKKQRRERNASPQRESHTPVNRSPVSSPQPRCEKRRPSREGEARASFSERESRLPSLESENRQQLESTDYTVKTEAPSIPSSPVLQGNEVVEQSNSRVVLPDSRLSPRASEPRSHPSTNYQNQSAFEPFFEVKEEFVDSESERSVQDVSFSPPTVADATMSPTLFIAATSATATSPTSVATNSRTNVEGGNFEDHIRTMLFNTHERRDALHSEAGFHRPGPSGLLGGIGVHVREEFRTGSESYSTKALEGYPAHASAVGSSHALPLGGPHTNPEKSEMKGSLSPKSELLVNVPEIAIDYMLAAKGKKVRKVHSCRECGYGTSNHTVFLAHCRTHTGERPYFCTFCSFRCAQYGTLWNHLRTHTKRKRYACQHCPFRCKEKRQLKGHLKQHFPDLCQ